MPRTLSSNLDAIMLRASTRSPAWEVLIYDVRSSTDKINDVVLFNVTGSGSLNFLTGPLDITDLITSITINEQRGDFVAGGVTASTATVQMVDETGLLDPLLILGLDPASQAYQEALGRYFRKSNVVTIRLGDSRADPSEWPFIFTGEIQGQAGRARSRSDGAQSVLSFKAATREARHSQFERTSSNFNTATTLLQAANLIAQDEMGLDLQEIDLSGWGTATFGHESVQLVEETPMSMLAKLMFIDGFLPKFDGLGRLTQISSTITGNPQREYEDLNILRKVDRPMSEIEQPNCVTVLGLDSALSKITQPLQRIATADITTGFFTNGEEFDVFWSDDETQVCDNVQSVILKSINQGISILGGGEEFTLIPSPGPGGGFIGVKVTMDTGFAPWLVVFLLTLYVVFAAIPDLVVSIGGGETIPVGRIIQAAALGAAVYIMTKIGRGQYEWMGEPMEYVYKEIRCRACVDGSSVFERNTLTIENHLINSKVDARNAAKNTLFLLQAQENPRDIQMLHDLRLEPDDIFELSSGRRFLIDSISYTLVRDPTTALRAAVKAFEVTSGVLA